MRASDLAFPLPLPGLDPDAGPVARRLQIAVELSPSAAYVWDDSDPLVVWDDPSGAYVWDAVDTAIGFTDVTCDFQALHVEAGKPDESLLFDVGQLQLSLANPTGEYSTLDVTGRLVYYAVGRRIAVRAIDPASSEWWWLFAGRITAWEVNPDDSVTVTAADGFAQLAVEPGRKWTVGAAGDTPALRMASILSAFVYTDPADLAQGNVALLVETVERQPLEELEVVALSDGGALFVDADGELTYLDRTFVAGRADQGAVHLFSDNVCEIPALHVWELTQESNDDRLADQVTLTNAATTPITVTATSLDPPLGVHRNYAHPDADLWTTSAEGQDLAGLLLARHDTPTLSFAFTLYPLDPNQPALFAAAADLRLTDLVEVAHEQRAQGGGSTVIDLDLLVATITHDLTPDQWVTEVDTSKAIGYRIHDLWDFAPFTWDDTSPDAVWSI